MTELVGLVLCESAKIHPVMPPKLKFGEGERILCYHGPLIYEAKCMKGQLKDKVTKYLIHYNGWNKNWDEWVPENRVLKFNEANLQKQRELREQNLYVFPKFSKESTILTLVVDGWIDQKLKKEISSSDNYFDQPAKPRAFVPFAIHEANIYDS